MACRQRPLETSGGDINPVRGHLSVRHHRQPLKYQATHTFWPLDGKHLLKKEEGGVEMKEETEGGSAL